MTDVIAQLVRRFPNCFAKLPRDRRPLQNGIEFSITALAPEIPECEVTAALSDYTSHRSYLRKLVEGAERIDLHGDPSGVVSREEALRARSYLDWRKMECPQDEAQTEGVR